MVTYTHTAWILPGCLTVSTSTTLARVRIVHLRASRQGPCCSTLPLRRQVAPRTRSQSRRAGRRSLTARRVGCTSTRARPSSQTCLSQTGRAAQTSLGSISSSLNPCRPSSGSVQQLHCTYLWQQKYYIQQALPSMRAKYPEASLNRRSHINRFIFHCARCLHIYPKSSSLACLCGAGAGADAGVTAPLAGADAPVGSRKSETGCLGNMPTRTEIRMVQRRLGYILGETRHTRVDVGRRRARACHGRPRRLRRATRVHRAPRERRRAQHTRNRTRAARWIQRPRGHWLGCAPHPHNSTDQSRADVARSERDAPCVGAA